MPMHLPPLAALLAQQELPVVLSPVLLLFLCVVAGLATVYLLPSRREPAVRTVAGVALVAAALILLAAAPAMRNERGVGGAAAFYFWAFAAVAVAAAVRVVTHPRPVYSALYFVLTVFASAGLFVLTGAEFMSAALVIIYAGAILVTYVFVIMLASQQAGDSAGHAGPGNVPTNSTAPAGYDRDSREPLVAAALGFTLVGVLLFVTFDRSAPPTSPIATTVTFAEPAAVANPAPVVAGQTQQLGDYLVRHQLVQLEVGAVVLLVSMVGAIVITRRRVVHVPLPGEAATVVEVKPEVLHTAATPVDDNPHSIPVYGTTNPRRKAYPQT